MFMTPDSVQTLGSSLQAMPVAMVFSTKMLLTQTSADPPETENPDGKPDALTVRATCLTAILKNIPGYSHGGLNE
jgi:hypothetical protein